MRSVSIFYLFLFLSATNALAQYPVWFKDDFDNGSKNWYGYDYSGPAISRKIEQGKYYMDHKDTLTNIYWSLVSIFSNPNKPFMIETNFVQTDGNGANGVGILIRGKEEKYYYFIINSTSKIFWVGSGQNGAWKNFNGNANNGWLGSSAINEVGKSNNLKLHAHDGKVDFMVNDQLAYTSTANSEFAEMYGSSSQGLVTCSKMKIEVDNYTVYQDNPPVNVVPNLPRMHKINLGATVNSKYVEKCPYIAPDGKTLYYNVEGDPANTGIKKDDDIYFSTALNDSTWSPRQSMGSPFNNDWPNCVISASPDNNTLYLMHTYNADGTPKGGGFSITSKSGNGWSMPTDLKVQNYYNNSIHNEFCFSADRKVLLMSVRRNETFGENDIYVSFLLDNGEFSEPKNLGNVVNTFAWESTPFLAADGVSLYYSTAGHPGFGDADIFMTRRLDSTWTNWSTPLNMGPDINSSNWEAYFCLAASGKYAFVTSTQNGIEGSLDIFQIKLPEALKPKPVVLIYGKVLNSKTKQPLESNINYNILATNKEIGIATSAGKDGTYKIVLPAGEVYSFLAKKDQYYSVSENIDVSGINKYQELERDLYLVPLEVGGNIRLNNLFFDFNKWNLRMESFPELNRLIKLLNENPTMEIEIAGHTDNVGADEINNKLSQERAMSVKNYLVGKGISTAKITAKGYGKTKPVAENATDKGRQTNRRVEFMILKK